MSFLTTRCFFSEACLIWSLLYHSLERYIWHLFYWQNLCLFFFYCLLDVLLHVDFNNNMPQSLGLWRVPIWGWMTPLLGRRLKKDFQIYTFNDNDTTCYLLFSPGYPTPEEEEARRIAEMGKPILGEYSRLEVMIEESCEFKVMELLQADKHGLHFRINFKLQH